MGLRREVLPPRLALGLGDLLPLRQRLGMGALIIVLCALIGGIEVVSQMIGSWP